MTRPFLPGLVVALGVLVLGLIVAFTVGRYPVTLAELVDVIWSRATGGQPTAPAAAENVILLVRGPRVVAAVLVGAALAVAGTAFQGLFRNPLVSPDILGASSGAALGAVLGIFFSLVARGGGKEERPMSFDWLREVLKSEKYHPPEREEYPEYPAPTDETDAELDQPHGFDHFANQGSHDEPTMNPAAMGEEDDEESDENGDENPDADGDDDDGD